MDSRYVSEIVRIATEEATPRPFGKVNDKEPVFKNGKRTNERYGWERLKEYFDVAARFTERHWKIPGYLDGVRVNNKRIPPGIHWCGIFATWVWIKAGIPGVHWGATGITGPNVKKVWGSKGIGIGDIGVLSGGLAHHFIVADINGENLETINGNSDYQGITFKKNTTKQVIAYYTIEDKFFEFLKSQYGQQINKSVTNRFY